MHAVKQDATHLLFTSLAHCKLQMYSANCGNNQFLEIENENDEDIQELIKQESFYKPNVISITRRTVHNLLQCCQRRIEAQQQATYTKNLMRFGCLVPERYACR